jgi:hypothetical protein
MTTPWQTHLKRLQEQDYEWLDYLVVDFGDMEGSGTTLEALLENARRVAGLVVSRELFFHPSAGRVPRAGFGVAKPRARGRSVRCSATVLPEYHGGVERRCRRPCVGGKDTCHLHLGQPVFDWEDEVRCSPKSPSKTSSDSSDSRQLSAESPPS